MSSSLRITGKPLFSVIASLALALPAHAQMTGTRFGKNANKEDVPQVTRLMAECVVKRQRNTVLGWFKLLPGTDEEFRYIQRQEGELGNCLEDRNLVFTGQLRFEPRALRYPVALATARDLLSRNGEPPASLRPDVPAWFASSYRALPQGAKVDLAMLALHDFGQCVASANWNASRALILSEEKTPEEKAAIAALVPSLGPCLDADAKIKVTPQNIRIAVAEPMVHLAALGGS